MSKDQWIADHERTLEDYADDGDREGATAELRGLGFTKEEAADQLDDIDREQATETTVETLREEKSRNDLDKTILDIVKPPRRRHKAPEGECSACDRYRERGESFHPDHDAGSNCESGKHSHCSCDWCF